MSQHTLMQITTNRDGVVSRRSFMRSMGVGTAGLAADGAHPRAVYQLHTGYLPSGAIKYPAFGAAVSKELGVPDFELPYFVSVGGWFNNGVGSGFLGMRYAPFVVAEPNRMPGNSQITV